MVAGKNCLIVSTRHPGGRWPTRRDIRTTVTDAVNDAAGFGGY
jgi:hypothetical protein